MRWTLNRIANQDEAQRHGNREDPQHGPGAIDAGERLGKVNLRDRTDLAGRIPGPGPHDQNAPRIAVAGQAGTAAALRHRLRRHR